MTLMDKEKDAIRTLAELSMTCNNQCATCELGGIFRVCVAEIAHLTKKRLDL